MHERSTIMQAAIDAAGACPAGVIGVIVDPADRSIIPAWLPTLEPCGCGLQLEPWWLAGLLGTRRIVQVDLAPGEVILAAEPEGGRAWRCGEGGPLRGYAIIVGYRKDADAYCDTQLTLQMVSALVTFGTDEDEAEEHDARTAA
jgi:hypothetical protein